VLVEALFEEIELFGLVDEEVLLEEVELLGFVEGLVDETLLLGLFVVDGVFSFIDTVEVFESQLTSRLSHSETNRSGTNVLPLDINMLFSSAV